MFRRVVKVALSVALVLVVIGAGGWTIAVMKDHREQDARLTRACGAAAVLSSQPRTGIDAAIADANIALNSPEKFQVEVDAARACDGQR